jgi:uncharacterized protein
MTYVERTLEASLRKAARQFPVVMVTGPRQSGKTTTLRQLFGRTHRYVSLEPPDTRLAAESDPRGFLDLVGERVILDEVQYAPSLLPYIKERVDANRAARGRYILTGSQNLVVHHRVTESLAGRAAVLRLLPLTQREMAGLPRAPLPWETRRRTFHSLPVDPKKTWMRLLRGGYPEIHTEPRRDAELWHASYVQTYLERDVRSLRQVGDLTQFQLFLRTLAARSGQLLNLADVGRDLGIALNTAKAWLSVLEATDQIFVLRPFHVNLGKRLVKTPKVYFADTGTLCYLVGLRDPEHARSGPLGGAIFETAVIGEIRRSIIHSGTQAQIFFWRTSTGNEVDLVVQTPEGLVPVEIKLSATPKPSMANGIASLRRDTGPMTTRGYVIHPGDVILPLGPDAVALPYTCL